MFRKNLLVSGLVLAIASVSASSVAARPFTAEMMATLDRVSDPRLSPDGRLVLFDVRSVDFPANKSHHSLWLAETDGKSAPRRLAVSDDGASSGRWSADGKRIYFLSGRKDGVDQVFMTDLKGESATQVTSLPTDVGAFKLAHDGKTLVVALAVLPECPDLACSEERLAARKTAKTSGVVYDRLFVRHWDSWADGRRNHLFALSLDDNGVAAGKPTDLMPGFDGDSPTKPFGDDEDFAISPDSKDLVFSAKIAGRDEAWSTNFDLFAVPLDAGRKPADLTEANKAWDAAPVFSSDGKWAAYRAMKRPGFEADRFAVILHDEATGKEREVAPDWDRSAQSVKWGADNRTLYVTAEDVGQDRLFAIDSQSGKVNALTGSGHVSGFDVGADKLVFAADDLSHPAQIFVADLKGTKVKALTSFNADKLAGVEWGETEQFAFAGWNNEIVHGYVVKPAGFEAGKRYPVAFLIHGGPQGSFGNLFHYRWNAEAFAGAGYAVVMIDFHGSTGYGQAFTDAISRHWGDRPLEDLQKGWQFALAKNPFLDADRACALGGSYGGFMINWIAGNWNQPWKCLVNHDGIYDTRFMGTSTEELWFAEWENGGMPWDQGADYTIFNPAEHVAAWSKPTLVVEGGKDYRVPLEEAISTFTALQRKGVPSKFLYFPDENHWVLKPQNVVQWYSEVTGWLDRWTGVK